MDSPEVVEIDLAKGNALTWIAYGLVTGVVVAILYNLYDLGKENRKLRHDLAVTLDSNRVMLNEYMKDADKRVNHSDVTSRDESPEAV